MVKRKRTSKGGKDLRQPCGTSDCICPSQVKKKFKKLLKKKQTPKIKKDIACIRRAAKVLKKI